MLTQGHATTCAVSRYMLRVFFTVLGFLVITDGELKNVKVSDDLTNASRPLTHSVSLCS